MTRTALLSLPCKMKRILFFISFGISCFMAHGQFSDAITHALLQSFQVQNAGQMATQINSMAETLQTANGILDNAQKVVNVVGNPQAVFGEAAEMIGGLSGMDGNSGLMQLANSAERLGNVTEQLYSRTSGLMGQVQGLASGGGLMSQYQNLFQNAASVEGARDVLERMIQANENVQQQERQRQKDLMQQINNAQTVAKVQKLQAAINQSAANQAASQAQVDAAYKALAAKQADLQVKHEAGDNSMLAKIDQDAQTQQAINKTDKAKINSIKTPEIKPIQSTDVLPTDYSLLQ